MKRNSIAHHARIFTVALALVLCAGAASGTTITIVNLDGPGEGFNDPTPVAPVGGNPGTTLGAQRLYVFEYAANIWESLLTSPVEILVEANFDPQTCDATSAVLGSAGPNTLHSDFDNADRTSTWYHQSLANRIAGYDLDPATADIGTTFNSSIGTTCAFPLGWYYGVDGNEGTSAIELLPVVLHELGHGLNFSTPTLAGVQEVFPGIYDHFLYDNVQGMHWPEMTDGQRAASSQGCGSLVWDGVRVTMRSAETLGPKPLLRVNSPAFLAGDNDVGLASFGPQLSATPVTGNLVLVQDPVGLPNNGCEQPFLNAAAIAGNIALIDRGGCAFVIKAKNAQNAGAIAVVVADSAAGCPPAGMSGVDPTITIPTVRVTQDDGAALKAALLSGPVNVTLMRDPALDAGADNAGHVRVYTPAPYQLGSSVSHWDTACDPNLLMEPALNFELSQDVDLTVPAFADMGWYRDIAAVEGTLAGRRALGPAVPNPARGPVTITYALPREGKVELAIYDLTGALVTRLVQGVEPEGSHTTRWDGRDAHGRPSPAGIYYYRLKAPNVEESRKLMLVN